MSANNKGKIRTGIVGIGNWSRYGHAAFVRDAIAAGKDVYCEWPLTTNREDTEDLLARAEAAGVRHIVGLQRRLGPSARYVRDLLVRLRPNRGFPRSRAEQRDPRKFSLV
jgi:predicted dehydrogenase